MIVYLGVTFDDVMSLGPLMKHVKTRLSNKIFMLCKIRKFLTFDAAVLVCKPTISPILVYAGFMLIANRKEDKNDLQVLQNDILWICDRSHISDIISIEKLHAKCKLISLEQRRRKQLLSLMSMLSHDKNYLHVPGRATRNAYIIVFKVPTKIGNVWNDLPQSTQEATSIFEFKNIISHSYSVCKEI